MNEKPKKKFGNNLFVYMNFKICCFIIIHRMYQREQEQLLEAKRETLNKELNAFLK